VRILQKSSSAIHANYVHFRPGRQEKLKFQSNLIA